MQLNTKEAFISALDATEKNVAFLIGSPFSADDSGNGIPDISQILDIVREVVLEKRASEVARYDRELAGKTGPSAYQSAMGWLQANIHQDAVNMVVRRAVLKSCLDFSTIGDQNNPSCDGEPSHWHLPIGIRSLASLICSSDSRFQGPVLTPNFDPLLSLAIRAEGKRPSRITLDADGSLPRDVDEETDTKSIIHLHGYWRGTDTLHTPTQLHSHRPKLKVSLQRLLRKHLLVVVAYGGWDDIFTNALAELIHDDQAEIDVLWCFRETESTIVQAKNKNLLSSVAPALGRGRFRGYGGIDCHSIFSDIATTLGIDRASQSAFSSTDTGRESVMQSLVETNQQANSSNDFVDRYLTKRLDDALVSFSSQPKVWVEPTLCKSAETDKTETVVSIDLVELLSNPKSIIIKAPPQFGLTCLALYLTREAWRTFGTPIWIYLDSKNLKPNKASIEQAVENELQLLGCQAQDIKCIILDSWSTHEKNSDKLLNKICEYYNNIPIVVMQTIENSHFLSFANKEELVRKFEEAFLWSLARVHVRKVVSDYNEARHIGDENKITSKVVSDLEVLNLHRTPLNCLTLLKVSEVDFDESPVNRSEMIKRVLFLLFNVDDIPTYKVRPDLKDSEYVIGYFCESMLRGNNYSFTREHFLALLERCCKERFIDLEVQVVFDVLYRNNILVRRGSQFGFRFTFWIYYFAAQRMHHNPQFAEFIYEDMRYTKYPEILEYYTGVDRQREDALHILIRDVRATCDQLQNKCGIPDGLNPYRFAKWSSSDTVLSQMQDELNDGVMESNLPEAVKDHYADRQYDRTRPYDQDIRNILDEYTYVRMVQSMRAGSRALRNSDYADPETKRQLLREIMNCWDQVSKIMLILTPLLAKNGRAVFEGQAFFLGRGFSDTYEDRLHEILNEVPCNVVSWFQEDLFSQKMGPLLIDQIINDSSDIRKHELILMLINQRPRGWKTQVQQYITSISKKSFYLWDVHRNLRVQYSVSYMSPSTLEDTKYLIQMAIAKHLTGSKRPGKKLINNVEDRLPNRLVANDEE